MCSGQGQRGDSATRRLITWIGGGQLLAVSLGDLSHRRSGASTDEGGQTEETELAPQGLSTARPQAPQQPQSRIEAARSCTWRLEGQEEVASSELGWGTQELSLPLCLT